MSISLDNNNICSTGFQNDKRPMIRQSDLDSMNFDQEMVKSSGNTCTFATPISKEELFKQWDQQIKSNQDQKMTVYEMLAARPFAKQLMYSMVGSSKVYTFDEYVKEMEKVGTNQT